VEQHSRIVISFRVSSGSYGIPSGVTGSVRVQAFDDSVEYTDAIGFRQLQQLGFEDFYWFSHRDSARSILKLATNARR
jgi:hypothetical protein